MADDDSTVRLHIGIATDADGYLRQECPACLLEFKLRGDEVDFHDVLNSWASRALRDAGIESEGAEPAVKLACPYCAEQADRQDFLHPETRSLVRRITLREIAEPMLHRFFEELGESWSRGSGGFLTVRSEGNFTRSPRPISGPEANDMVRVHCMACDAQFKLMEGWGAVVCCPACFAKLSLS